MCVCVRQHWVRNTNVRGLGHHVGDPFSVPGRARDAFPLYAYRVEPEAQRPLDSASNRLWYNLIVNFGWP